MTSKRFERKSAMSPPYILWLCRALSAQALQGLVQLVCSRESNLLLLPFPANSASSRAGEHKVNFVVLEARDRVGGRVFTEPNSGLDFGAAWMTNSKENVLTHVVSSNEDFLSK